MRAQALPRSTLVVEVVRLRAAALAKECRLSKFVQKENNYHLAKRIVSWRGTRK